MNSAQLFAPAGIFRRGRQYLLMPDWQVDEAVTLPINRPHAFGLAVERDAVLGEGTMAHWRHPAMRAWPRYRTHALHLRNGLPC